MSPRAAAAVSVISRWSRKRPQTLCSASESRCRTGLLHGPLPPLPEAISSPKAIDLDPNQFQPSRGVAQLRDESLVLELPPDADFRDRITKASLKDFEPLWRECAYDGRQPISSGRSEDG